MWHRWNIFIFVWIVSLFQPFVSTWWSEAAAVSPPGVCVCVCARHASIHSPTFREQFIYSDWLCFVSFIKLCLNELSWWSWEKQLPVVIIFESQLDRQNRSPLINGWWLMRKHCMCERDIKRKRSVREKLNERVWKGKLKRSSGVFWASRLVEDLNACEEMKSASSDWCWTWTVTIILQLWVMRRDWVWKRQV